MFKSLSALFGSQIVSSENSSLQTQTSQFKTLRGAAKNTSVYIGAAINYGHLQNDTQYIQVAADEFSLITAENSCKMMQIAKSFDDLDFTECQYVVENAKKNKQAFRAHNLIWAAPYTEAHKHNPTFIYNEKNATRLEEFMGEYITKTMDAIGDYPYAWDVVNEAIIDGTNPAVIYKDSPWSIIDDFVCKSFKAARKASPKMKLFYNDYKHASMTGTFKTKSDKVFNMVKEMKERGVDENGEDLCPIDGVGFQNHIDINYDQANFHSIRQNIQRYAAIGIEVQFTETDVKCTEKSEECPWTNWPQSALETQASIYSKILAICLSEPNCTSFETWGYTDKYAAFSNDQKGLPFDSEFGKKPAYNMMLQTLANHQSQSDLILEPQELYFMQ